ncbi:MAG: hypothetical protein NTV77_03335 [Candidatus Azambacteria bacterium]|nr:hypothetical protein [Candidatus Azambacteria bacterium]
MKIIDENNLIPDKKVLTKIIKKHPLRKNPDNHIHNLIIKLSEQCCIELDKNKDVTLFLTENVSLKSIYEYVLFHEFSHIFDKLNPEFKYADIKRDALSDTEKEAVMEIWNVYIDSRLNRFGLFKIEDENQERQFIIGKEYQKLIINIETKLKFHIHFLQNRNVKNAKDIIDNIWENPVQFLSYDDIINITKAN